MNRTMARRLRPLAAALTTGSVVAEAHVLIGRPSATAAPMATAGASAGVGRLAVAAVAHASTGNVGHAVVAVERPSTHIETTDHEFIVPLDWSITDGESIVVFAREVVSLKKLDKRDELPWLVFLQGGPGGAAIRPAYSGWLKRALSDYRVLLLDQRGTGCSTPVTSETFVARCGTDAAAGAGYLANFRADSIVADAEAIRVLLAGRENTWDSLGQSYGGFLTLHYLSAAPKSLGRCFVTGGLASVARLPTDNYTYTNKTVLARNAQYYRKYPEDIARVRKIVAKLAASDGGRGVPLPGGGRLSVRRFLQLGMKTGMAGGMDQLHWQLEGAFRHDGDELSHAFLRSAEAETESTFETSPIFSILHESIYQHTQDQEPSRWAAERVHNEKYAAEYDYEARLAAGDDVHINFTGEMIFSWMFDGDYPLLKPMQGAAELLAARSDWPALYDIEVLRDCSVCVAAAVYAQDLYVEREFSEETAELLGASCKIWITNEHQHSGLREDGEGVLDRLIAMASGELEVPP